MQKMTKRPDDSGDSLQRSEILSLSATGQPPSIPKPHDGMVEAVRYLRSRSELGRMQINSGRYGGSPGRIVPIPHPDRKAERRGPDSPALRRTRRRSRVTLLKQQSAEASRHTAALLRQTGTNDRTKRPLNSAKTTDTTARIRVRTYSRPAVRRSVPETDIPARNQSDSGGRTLC